MRRSTVRDLHRLCPEAIITSHLGVSSMLFQSNLEATW
jgi:hypothetical protein